MAAPNFILYPIITDNTTGTTITASGSIDDSGVLKMVIVPQTDAVPSAAQIYAGQNASGIALPAGRTCSANASASGINVTLSGYGLTSQTVYDMYVVASGTGSGVGLQASGWGNGFVTPDVTDPTWEVGYPTIGSFKGRTAKVSMALSETGSGFYVVIPTAIAVAPTALQIRTGKDSYGAAIPSGLFGTINLTGTAPGTSTVNNLAMAHNYTIYVTARDTSGNDVTPLAVSSANFRSAGGGMPGRFSPGNIAKDRAKTANRLTNALRNIGR